MPDTLSPTPASPAPTPAPTPTPVVNVSTGIIGKQTATALAILIVGGGLAGYISYKDHKNLQNEQNLINQNKINQDVAFEKLTKDLVYQASVSQAQTADQLKAQLSQSYQDQINKVKDKLLAEMDTQFKVWGSGRGNGSETTNGVYRFPDPKNRGDEKLLNFFEANVSNPKSPTYKYELNPMSFTLNSTLGITTDDGKPRFWVQPAPLVKSQNLNIDIEKSELKPTPELNAWMQDLQGHKTQVAVPPKYTVILTGGRDFTYATGFPKNVLGATGLYNTTSGISFGGGSTGNIIHVDVGYSWGKR